METKTKHSMKELICLVHCNHGTGPEYTVRGTE